MTFKKIIKHTVFLAGIIILIGCAPKKTDTVENKPTDTNKTQTPGTLPKDSLDIKVGITLADKQLQAPSSADPKEYIVLIYNLKNNTAKNIKGVDADVTINDENGKEVKKVKISEVEQINAGAEKQYKALYSFNAFSDKDVRLKGIDLKNMKIDSKVLTIIYEDGRIEKIK